MTTRVTEGARRERHDKRESLFFLLGLPPSFLNARARVHTPFTISEEKERLLAVYRNVCVRGYILYRKKNSSVIL